MLEVVDSLPELVFYVTNIGIIVIGLYFLVAPKTFAYKLLLSSPLLLMYVITPTAFLIGCKLTLFSSATCREWFWLYVLIPPYVFGFCLVELVMGTSINPLKQ